MSATGSGTVYQSISASLTEATPQSIFYHLPQKVCQCLLNLGCGIFRNRISNHPSILHSHRGWGTEYLRRAKPPTTATDLMLFFFPPDWMGYGITAEFFGLQDRPLEILGAAVESAEIEASAARVPLGRTALSSELLYRDGGRGQPQSAQELLVGLDGYARLTGNVIAEPHYRAQNEELELLACSHSKFGSDMFNENRAERLSQWVRAFPGSSELSSRFQSLQYDTGKCLSKDTFGSFTVPTWKGRIALASDPSPPRSNSYTLSYCTRVRQA